MRDDMTHPNQHTVTAKLVADRIRDLPYNKTQAEIVSAAGFANASMMTYLKNVRTWIEFVRVISCGSDPRVSMRFPKSRSIARAIRPASTQVVGNYVGLNGRPARRVK